MLISLSKENVNNWDNIHSILNNLEKHTIPERSINKQKNGKKINRGVAFITFNFGIDGVSIEIQKYALILEKLFASRSKNTVFHFISGDFHDKADTVLLPRWKRFKIEGTNGWSKWDDGKWFSGLFYSDMPDNSDISDFLAKEIWKQTLKFSGILCSYIIENNIDLLIPVNICSNPGNLAINLAVIIVTELLKIKVISSNHDFYWEGGKTDRKPGEEAGVRDHFFRNYKNRPFFKLFEAVYPWNGRCWLQVNINKLQSHKLVEKYRFPKNKVYKIGSCLSNKFFEEYTFKDVMSARKRMAYILSDGKPIIKTVQIEKHLMELGDWMPDQKPVVCGYNAGSELDLTKNETIYCLQPTRVIARKCIYRDFKLIAALLKKSRLKDFFEKNSSSQLVLHITGPVPIEHQNDLVKVLQGYKQLCKEISLDFAKRIFVAFSVGTEKHPSLQKNGLEELSIEEIYRMADIVLFPSETEGRGLPIIESGASGVPIVCRRYSQEEVFDDVVGKNLEEKYRIKYILFPDKDDFPKKLLSQISSVLLDEKKRRIYSSHNRRAVRHRYSYPMLINKFAVFLKVLANINEEKGKQECE